MIDKELEKRIESCRIDYETQTKTKCHSFFCPIFHRDETVEMCRGHIVTLGTKSIWVPQRKDVDNFYGSVAEAEFAIAVSHRNADPIEAFLNSELRRKIRPTIEVAGEQWEHYVTKSSTPGPGHTMLHIVDANGEKVCNVGLKIRPDKLLETDDQQINFVIDRDFVPSVIASAIKGAHLTMFRMLGYQYVLSPGGRLLASILRDFYEKHNGSHSVTSEEVARYFSPLITMVVPMGVSSDDHLQGTAEDNMLISCFAATEGLFALGVIVRAKGDRFCVFLPTDYGKSVNTYFSFLKEPPPSIAARFTRFRPASEDQESCWEADSTLIRIPLNQEMPASAGG